MTRMLLNVYDNGLFWVVNNAFVSEEYMQNFTNTVNTIEIRDTLTFAAIVDALATGRKVKLPKNVGLIGPGDLIIDVADEFSASKNSAYVKISNVMNSRLGNRYNYDFFKFNILNNKLISKGYSITDDNKEEKYLEILETADDAMISLLQGFLEVQSKIQEYYNIYDQGTTAINNLEDCTTVTEVDTVLNTFISQYN